jgi:hypothetical protein
MVPLFNTCSFYFKSPRRPGLAAAYRKAGGSRLRAYPPVYVIEDRMFRGSIVDLDEDTSYGGTNGWRMMWLAPTWKRWETHRPSEMARGIAHPRFVCSWDCTFLMS